VQQPDESCDFLSPNSLMPKTLAFTPHVQAGMPAHDSVIPHAVSSLFCNTANHFLSEAQHLLERDYEVPEYGLQPHFVRGADRPQQDNVCWLVWHWF
jgi:hypothetical protein